MTALTVSRLWLNFKDEDYTDSVCLLLPKGQATLIDVEHFDWAISYDWLVMGRAVFYVVRTPVIYWELPWIKGRTQRRRLPATSQIVLFHREAILQGVSSNERHNLSLRLRRRHVDHASRNPWDNRKKNLRVATPSQNAHNTSKRKGGSSQYKGVSKVGPNSWRVSVRIRRKLFYLGTFRDEVQAAIAYNEFVADRCGEFAVLNPIVALPTDEPGKRPPKRYAKVSRKPEPPVSPETPNDWRSALREAIEIENEREQKRLAKSAS